MAKTKKIDMVAKIGRRGTEATIAFRAKVAHGGVMQSANTRRNRTRSDRKRNALRDAE